MLSTMSGMRCFLAIAAMALRSTMTPPGLAMDSTKIALVFGRDGRLEGRRIVRIGPGDVPAEVLERVVELVDRAAIELVARRRTRRPAASARGRPGTRAAWPDATASAAVPPSSAATRSSSTAQVGLPMRE